MTVTDTRQLFQKILGDAAFSTLSPRVQALHRALGTRTYLGEADVDRGRGMLSRLAGWVTAQPLPAHRVALEVDIAADANGETWTRRFAGHPMRSRLWTNADASLLMEKLGLVTFGFALHTANGSLIWAIRSVSALGIRLPAQWFSGVQARESEVAGRYHFDVEARMPLAGLLVHYRGWLDVE